MEKIISWGTFELHIYSTFNFCFLFVDPRINFQCKLLIQWIVTSRLLLKNWSNLTDYDLIDVGKSLFKNLFKYRWDGLLLVLYNAFLVYYILYYRICYLNLIIADELIIRNSIIRIVEFCVNLHFYEFNFKKVGCLKKLLDRKYCILGILYIF